MTKQTTIVVIGSLRLKRQAKRVFPSDVKKQRQHRRYDPDKISDVQWTNGLPVKYSTRPVGGCWQIILVQVYIFTYLHRLSYSVSQ